MFCANCSEKIMGESLKQAGEFFCSVECANMAHGIDADEPMVDDTEEIDEDFRDDDR